jgi:hypothetical protein
MPEASQALSWVAPPERIAAEDIGLALPLSSIRYQVSLL